MNTFAELYCKDEYVWRNYPPYFDFPRENRTVRIHLEQYAHHVWDILRTMEWENNHMVGIMLAINTPEDAAILGCQYYTVMVEPTSPILHSPTTAVLRRTDTRRTVLYTVARQLSALNFALNKTDCKPERKTPHDTKQTTTATHA